MARKFPELRKAIDSAKLIQLPQPGSKKYKFKIFPFGERGTKINFKLLSEISTGMADSIKKHFPDFDYIVSPEPGGHTWGILMASSLKKPINILRYNPSYVKGEMEVRRKTGYYQHNLYFSHFKPGDRVLIVDDIISTGGTMKTILNTLKSLKVKPVGIQVIFVKSRDFEMLGKEYNVSIKYLED